MTQDGIYWLFASSAQTVAAFVAFLLAGFALSIGMLDNAGQRDETLTEMIDVLKRDYYRKIRGISYLTGLAIVTNLLIVLFQSTSFMYHWSLLLTGVCLNIITIFLTIHFTVGLVDPDRVEKVARRLLKERPQPIAEAPSVNFLDFMAAFIPVERKLNFVADKEYDIFGMDSSTGQRFFPFSRIVRLLLSHKRITETEAERLLELARYRNLVVHGQVESVEKSMVNEAHSLLALLDERFP